ncbi:MAG TPA: methylated-DNA--[protein]-cysteine S-methyltransferase [Paludibacter sp.]|nr:methylated-DNA--[protein]-cysteine S-methyltransferase [Paludibacter sp.]
MNNKSQPAELSYGFSGTPFGECCIAFTDEGICALLFPENRETAWAYLKKHFPHTNFTPNGSKAGMLANLIFEKGVKPAVKPAGTEFQLLVWEALQQIPPGSTTTYARIAAKIGRPKAVRAVGTAIGANPVAYLIPCHRVIRTDGTLGGFRWGLDCKRIMLARENENQHSC